MGIYSIYGLYNNKLVKDFKTAIDYGNIIVNVKEATTRLSCNFIRAIRRSRCWKNGRSREMGRSSLITWEGTIWSAILDRNETKWDTGNYLKHLQPEEIKYLPTEIKLKKNFDVEQDFDMSKTYKREDPSKRRIQKEIKRNRTNRWERLYW